MVDFIANERFSHCWRDLSSAVFFRQFAILIHHFARFVPVSLGIFAGTRAESVVEARPAAIMTPFGAVSATVAANVDLPWS
jgi:hypothetical protein